MWTKFRETVNWRELAGFLVVLAVLGVVMYLALHGPSASGGGCYFDCN